MEVSGKTVDGKLVISGVGKLCFTSGLPLEVALDRLKAEDWVMDWVDYITDALGDGHNPRTIRARIASAVGDVYGPVYRDEVMKRVNLYLPT